MILQVQVMRYTHNGSSSIIYTNSVIALVSKPHKNQFLHTYTELYSNVSYQQYFCQLYEMIYLCIAETVLQ